MHICVWFENTAVAFMLKHFYYKTSDANILPHYSFIRFILLIWNKGKTNELDIYCPRGSTSLVPARFLLFSLTSQKHFNYQKRISDYHHLIIKRLFFLSNIEYFGFFEEKHILIDFSTISISALVYWEIKGEEMIRKHSHVWRLAISRKKILFMEINHLSHYFYSWEFL